MVELARGFAEGILLAQRDLGGATPSNDCGIPVLVCDASYEAVAERAADVAEEAGTLAGWANNTAVSRIPHHSYAR